MMGRAATVLAAAALALAVLGGAAPVSADHVEGSFGGEHERVSLVRQVADLAIANLNAVEKPADEAFTLGRILEVDNAVQHTYKSIKARGVLLEVVYEALKVNTKQTAFCTAEIWETLRADVRIQSNSCDLTVKAGVPPADFVEPWSEASGTAMALGDETIRSAAGEAAFFYKPGATVLYVCSARVTSLTLLKKPFLRYYLAVATKADCSDAVAADVLYSPEDQFKVNKPLILPPLVGTVIKIILALVCFAIWGILWVYHTFQMKALKARMTIVRAMEKEEAELAKIKGVQDDNEK
mmetsp:Transcript_14948/g.36169  ORF Transcript_14948/g.36169 Transcript_14948/m.36169 type:complete len:296 (+) Transcript_14948:83-970(+)|eukprot:CAMPEP_0197592212 /NCGR_PEP_ID=MMETSP1326-20131121/14941_1 /TAXON_ID=1155430 /ORGANISM="Genus nov. species nov., Strain RCC2288" /LENGTH=295 /DNA_ID=CAMNT_0043157883 /DNA_START=62 /DNA_END=949 /DNA_ORIENTATION=+